MKTSLILKKHLNKISKSYSYVVIDPEKNHSWIIDIGDYEMVRKMIGNTDIQGILLTHIHYDHIYGLPDLLCVFKHVPIYTNVAGKNGLNDPYENLSFYYGSPLIVTESKLIKSIEEKETKEDLMNKGIEWICTPGHHPSCITWLIGDYLFTGDSYIPGQKVVTKLLSGNREKAVESEQLIKSLMDNKVVCAGH